MIQLLPYMITGLVAIACSAAVAYALTRGKTRKTPPNTDLLGTFTALHEKLKDRVADVENDVKGYNLKTAEIEEYVMRSMNRMAARYKKVSEFEAQRDERTTEEMLREQLVSQAQNLEEIEENGGQDPKEPDLFGDDPNDRPRLIPGGR